MDKALVAQPVGEAQRRGLSVEGEDGLLGHQSTLVLEMLLWKSIGSSEVRGRWLLDGGVASL